MCVKQTGWELNYDSGVSCWLHKIVTQGSVWSEKVLPIIINDILEQTQGTKRKDTWLPSNLFLLFRDRGGKFVDYKIPKKGHRQVSRKVERDYGHPSSGTYVPNKRRRRGGFLIGIQSW